MSVYNADRTYVQHDAYCVRVCTALLCRMYVSCEGGRKYPITSYQVLGMIWANFALNPNQRNLVTAVSCFRENKTYGCAYLCYIYGVQFM